MDERESRLPKWVQEELQRLRLRLETALEPAVEARRKLAAAEERIHRLEGILESLQELLFSAAKSGHRTAAEIISVLESYEIFPPSKGEAS